MTNRLYEQDPYCYRFEATVISCDQHKDGFAAVLDKTAFFPEGGGQPADPGCLDGIPVLDVQLDGDSIRHYTKTPLAVGATVVGEVDWPVRFSRMQKHTGEHIVSGLVFAHYGYNNCGFHLGSEDVTLDFDGELTRKQLDEIEWMANRVIWENVPVTARYPDAEELAVLPYRSKKPIDGPVRIVAIEGYDLCACCAPHIKRTGEIGALKLLDAIRYKGGMRIHMQCGGDALLDYRMRYTQTAAIASMLSVKQGDALQGVERLYARCSELERELKATQGYLAVAQAEAIPVTAGSACLFLDGGTPDSMRKAAEALSVRCTGVGAALMGSDAEGYRFVAMGNELQEFMTRMKNELPVRGGGNTEAVQGNISATKEQILVFFRSL